jgi:hypothetical protein
MSTPCFSLVWNESCLTANDVCALSSVGPGRRVGGDKPDETPVISVIMAGVFYAHCLSSWLD